jgi:type IX secretion system PorP/SprF family membrane protein
MRIRYCLIILFLLPFYTLSAQVDPRFTLFPWLNPHFNPGAMGETEFQINFTGVLRQHALGMRELDENASNSNDNNSSNDNNTGKPVYESQRGEQVLLNIDSYIKQIKGAVGVAFLKDRNGDGFDNIGFKFGYATRFKVRGGKLGIGVQFSFLNISPTGNYKPNEIGDPVLELAKESVLDFDMNFGIHYKTPTWHVGVSAGQLLGGVRISGEKNVFEIPRLLYITGGYIWNLNTAVPWSIEPSVFIRTEFATWMLDVMAVARYNGILWFGLAYQHNWAIAALFGAVPFYNNSNNYLKGLELGLAYSFPTNKLGYRSGGSMGDFELVVRYGFNFYKERALTGYGSSRHLHKNQY